MLFTIQNSTRNKQDTQTEKQGMEIYINAYLTTARSTAINSALSAVFKQRNVAKLQATAPPTKGGKKQILSSPQTTTTAADQKTNDQKNKENRGGGKQKKKLDRQ
jgi:flagellar motility protein MotE (MotC chaperone)